MTKKIDLVGRRYGRLVVVGCHGRDSTGKTTWNTLCDCGGTSIVAGLNLKTGTTKSCGCLKRRKGVDNPKYKVTPTELLKQRKRFSPEYRRWRRDVLVRCPVCVKCGADTDLHVHHIWGASEYPEKVLDPLNGIVFCAPCHMDFHLTYGRRKGFTEHDAERFVAFPLLWLVLRWRGKNGLQDLKKARHFLDLLIEMESGETK